jgi:hypothetical protein
MQQITFPSIVDNKKWLSLHAYIMMDWSQIPIKVSLGKVIEGVDSRI